ncbi:MAG TPA: aldehyde dehydrogenase family protein [Terriglobia bacterium]|jgi:acyl-CoA reductase-like NAD-dependent aldehyde dehydrogenase
MQFRKVINPARTSEIVGEVPMCSPADVDRVLDQAAAAFKTWARTTPEERSSRLLEAAKRLRNALPELAILFVRENGKPLREAEIDIRRSIELMELISADLPGWWKPVVVDAQQPVSARRRARGVTAVISPWNSPVLLSLKRVIPAIATGNTVVLKPATYCPLAIIRCAQLMNECLPPGVLNVVTGDGATIGELLATDERVRAIAFTGSSETGRRIMALGSRTVKKLYMELGGNDPALVLADASLDSGAIERMKNAVLRASGQVCIAIKRIYVHESRLDELTRKLSDSFDQVVVGDGLRPETTMGPLNNKAQFEFVNGLVEKCVTRGSAILTCGKKLDPHQWDQGFFMLPSIVLGAGPDDEIVQCEQFGPTIPILPFSNEDSAIACANHTPYGLRASVWTSNRTRAEEMADRLEAGAVFWNNHGIFKDLHIEFPGIKQSGFSRESRSAALEHYVDTYGFAE